MSYRSSDAMIRSLVTYIKDAREVRRRVMAEYPESYPSLRYIADMRARYERPGFSHGKQGRIGQDLNGPPILGASWHGDMREASRALHRKILSEHRPIMKRLEAQGNKVVWK